MELDRRGTEVLSREECVRLLSSQSVGRLGLHAGALPVILPVAYAVVDGEVVVRTADGPPVFGGGDTVVAFEVDRPPGAPDPDADADAGAGWSVHVTAMAVEITDPDELARLSALPLRSWAGGPDERFVRIPLQLLSGRRVSPIGF